MTEPTRPATPQDAAPLQVPLFDAFTDRERAEIQAHAAVRRRAAGEVVIWEGRRHRSLFVLTRGTATVSKTVRGQVESVLARLSPGAHFGELTLIDGRPASATVTAESDCELLEISYGALQELLQRDVRLYARLSWTLLQVLAERLRAANDKVQEAVEWGLDASE